MTKDNNIQKLASYRKRINKIDKKIVSLLAKRFSITEKIGRIKVKNNLPLKDENREKEIFSTLQKLSLEKSLDAEITKQIFSLIFNEVVKKHIQKREKIQQSTPKQPAQTNKQKASEAQQSTENTKE